MYKKYVFGIIFLLSNFACNAQELFYSNKTEVLFNSLNNICKIDSIPSNNYSFPCTELVLGDTVTITICKDENNVIEHIGCKFLYDSILIGNKPVTQFIERELLSILLSNDAKETIKTNDDDQLYILLDDKYIPADSLDNKSWFFDLWKNNYGTIINRRDNNYIATILCSNNKNLTFIFKADCCFISGMSKKEQEIKLAIQLSNYYASNTNNSMYLRPSYLQYYSNDSIVSDSVYVEKGENFVIPQINGDLFYIKNDTIYTPVFDTSYVALTFSNAMLLPSSQNYYIEVKHWMYGYKKSIYTMTSKDFFGFFSQDYEKYFGIESLENDHLTGTLILYNKNAEFIHMAFVSTTLDDLMNSGKIYIDLYSNIPQHNIKTLFGKDK
ncbi:MAG: hypothetical protein J6T81_00590 [Bacteroidales bacterium]|nr:hypothetical protein [Bacteroidales bacterium]